MIRNDTLLVVVSLALVVSAWGTFHRSASAQVDVQVPSDPNGMRWTDQGMTSATVKPWPSMAISCNQDPPREVLTMGRCGCMRYWVGSQFVYGPCAKHGKGYEEIFNVNR